ncbi:MAG: chlorite dismutase family protein [Beijerinckiaceae bacterium]|nr:chlorite dismutase family protein [Beijerinckiaceae bacterium]
MITTERAAANSRATTFVGGRSGHMLVLSHATLVGEPIARVEAVNMTAGISPTLPVDASWALHGVATNDRYTTRPEKTELVAKQAPIGRPEATHAALILLRKRAEWWSFTQDERRAILEEDSHHIAIGMRYLPAVARRLLHCRDLDEEAPFDFIGYLDYAPESEAAFDDMLAQLRATKEWSFIDREIDIRLTKADPAQIVLSHLADHHAGG